MRAILRRVRGASGDRGSALISAVAIAIIGGLLISVVATAVVVAAKDSGTDRARTSEVHTAEGAVDAAYDALEAGTPCRLPATGTYDAGTAPKDTAVYATIQYFDASNTALTCTSGIVTGGTPATAVITAVSTTSGENAKRTIQSKVNLTPLTAAGHGAAIFSASGVTPTNNFQLRSLDPDNEADLWVDSGNYSCSENGTIAGNLIVVNGTTTLDNRCVVQGDLWTRSTFRVNAKNPDDHNLVDGDVYVGGNAQLATDSRYGAGVNVAGSLTVPSGNIIAAGQVRTGLGYAALPQYVAQGLPTVLYRPSDFVGFANTGDRRAAYVAWVNSNSVANNSPTWATTRLATDNQCTVASANYSLNGPLVGPTVPTVFDLRNCSTVTFGPDLTIKLYADLVLYFSNFSGTNNLTVESADGQPHKLWLLSPDPDGLDNGTPTCGTSGGQSSGNINLAAGSFFRQPISTFFYTPCSATISNSVELYGQIYARNVLLQNNLHVAYVPLGVPGVDLGNTTPAGSSGVRVDIVYKREVAST